MGMKINIRRRCLPCLFLKRKEEEDEAFWDFIFISVSYISSSV
jgi:hypothetical protein